MKGSAAAGSTVGIYTNASCSGSPVASGSAAEFMSPGIPVSVPDNSTTTLRATATDQAGTSACSSSSISYVEDSAAPSPPTITGGDPPSPANNNDPQVKGTVGSDSPTNVKLYKNSTCTEPSATSGTVAAFTGNGIPVMVTDNTTSDFSARAVDEAGNESGCSNSITYVEDSAAPAPPTLTSTDPSSPANNSNPKVKGSAEADSTVDIHTNASCSGSPVAGGTAAEFFSPGVPVSVPENSTTTFWATATDQAGNTSSCSSSSVTYQQVTNQPPRWPSPTQTQTSTQFHYDTAGRLMGATTTITILTPAVDPDGDPLTYTWSASNGSISGNGLSATWTRVIEFGRVKGGTVTVIASDGRGGSAQLDIRFQ